MRRFFYYLISIVLFPVTLLGYVLWVGKGLLTWGKSGVSGTAQGPLAVRYTMDGFGIRPDQAAHRLLSLLPGGPGGTLAVAGWPMFLAHRLTGFVPRTYRYPYEGEVPPQHEASARVTFFDGVVDRYLDGIRQFVILGAGFDTRPYRLPKDSRVRSFEVDTPKTLAVKRETLAKAGIDASRVTFVAADFEKDDWLARLVEEGFDAREPALFLWEGVLIYLDAEAVEDTLCKIGTTAKGSVLAFDYFTSESIESNDSYWRFARWSTKAAGEPLKFGIDATPPLRDGVAELLRRCGLALVEQQTLGDETGGKRAWGGFAVGRVG